MEESQEMNGTDSTAFKTQNSVKTNTVITKASAPILPEKRSLMDHATPTAMVSAFCRAVLSHLIPHDFWGTGELRAHNERVFYQNVDRFIELRRFENLSLHEVSQGIKVSPPLTRKCFRSSTL
jgi:telomerase reverse transcriptase